MDSVPTVTFTGGGGTGANATASLGTAAVASVTLMNSGNGYTSTPTVSILPVDGNGTGATATVSLASITMNMQPKTIQELFDPDYGRMNSLLGVEIPFTNGIIQTTIPYTDIDAPTEIFKNSDVATAIGTLADGTQIWKIAAIFAICWPRANDFSAKMRRVMTAIAATFITPSGKRIMKRSQQQPRQ